MNRWIKADVPLLGELGEMGEPLGAEVDEPLVDPVIDELAKPIVEIEEQMVAPMMDMEEDLAMLFGDDDDSSDDDIEGPEGDEEVWKVGGASTAAAEGHSITLLAPGVPVPPSVIEDLYTRMGNLEYGHGLLVKKSFYCRGLDVGHGISGGERTGAGRAHVEQGQQAIQQLQTLVSEMSSRESTLMQCILGLDRRLAEVEKRPPGPQ
ncbi:hypothetical protein Tco_1558056 [Tanacetum coccineum]